jgi:hypothetical protein
MPVIIIRGPAKSGKTTIAQALRSAHINKRCGVLLIDEDNDGAVKPLIEKLLAGVELPQPPPADLSTLPWKPDPLVIIVGDASELRWLEIESAVPGFWRFMAPVYSVTTAMVE